MNSVRIKWPTGHVEGRADFHGKGKADQSAKRAAHLRGEAARPEHSVAQRNAILRDAAEHRRASVAHMASFNEAQAQARTIKSMVK